MRWYASLGRAREIGYVRARGRRHAFGAFVAYTVTASRAGSAVAVTVSKAVGPAVVRNLVRRRVKGALDEHTPPAATVRLVFVVKPAAAQMSYARLAADVAATLDRLRAA